MRRILLTLSLALVGVLAAGVPAAACAGLIGSNGTLQLLRTTTFVGYADGLEHYVTSFTFQGAGGQFGSIIPLPGVPTSVQRGGDWTLQRLIRETAPPVALRSAFGATAQSAGDAAKVLLTARIDALDITVLEGGGDAVGTWAKDHGFRLSPDAPEVLDFYAARSPIFLAAVFDGSAAKQRGQRFGDGTPVHITIPVERPWVPLRILSLGKQPSERVEADVFLLTAARPSLLPGTRSDLALTHSAKATRSLLDDLRSDKGMSWIPADGWLTKLTIDAAAFTLDYDLSIDPSGNGATSRVDAGLVPPAAPAGPAPAANDVAVGWPIALTVAFLSAALLAARRRTAAGA